MLIQEKTHVAIFLLLSVRAFSRSHACHTYKAGRGNRLVRRILFFSLAGSLFAQLL